tara:strand:+ start:6681 stop:7625 length:945 start_codon:yes stop_codon:yes gene_type:complete
MKTIKTISILFLSLITFIACNDADLNVDNADGNLSGGGLLDVKNTSINYVVGNPGPYTANIRVFQGAAKTTSIRIAKTFYSSKLVYNAETEKDDKVTIVSNTIDNFKTITLSDTDQNSMVSYSFDFSEMVDGLTLEGVALSPADGDYLVGDYWKFEYFSITSNGEYQNYSSTKATVSTRFAGTYLVLDSAYWNSGALQSGNWNGDEVVIESIDASIYKHNGLAYWADNAYYFTVDPDTFEITILGKDLDDADVLLNTSPIMTCENDLAFESLTCFAQATKNDETGEDILEFTTGYHRGTGATREFYEKMQKIVD